MYENLIIELININFKNYEASKFIEDYISYKESIINKYWNKKQLGSEKPLDSKFINILLNKGLNIRKAENFLKSCLQMKWYYENWINMYWSHWDCKEFIRNSDYIFLTNEQFLIIIYDLLRDSNSEEANDLLLERIDDLCSENKFSEIDDLIFKIDINKLDVQTMLGILSFTNIVYDELLLYRKILVSEIEKRLFYIEPDRFERLIEGLR